MASVNHLLCTTFFKNVILSIPIPLQSRVLHQRDSIVGKKKCLQFHSWCRKIETLFLRKLSFVVTLPVKCNLHFALGIFLRLCSVNIAIPSMNVRYIDSLRKNFFNFRKLKKLKANNNSVETVKTCALPLKGSIGWVTSSKTTKRVCFFYVLHVQDRLYSSSFRTVNGC